MSSAIEQFRAQREAVEDIRVRLTEVAEQLRAIKKEVSGLVKDEALLRLLRQEESWLREAERFVEEVQRAREREMREFWPSIWRRWFVAVVLALVATAAAGAGYVWAMRPYADELAELRSRVELLDSVAQRILQMTPAERRQFDQLMNSHPMLQR